MLKQKYEIGTKFKHYARKSIHTIVDIHTTYDSKNNKIRWEYIIENEIMGQKIIGPICQSAIDRSELIQA